MGRPTPENLKPLGSGKLTPEEERELRRKGALAKAAQCQQRKTLREALDYLLSKNYTNKNGEEATGIEIVAIGLFNKAKAGDTSALRLLAELIGEAKGEGVNITLPPSIIVQDAATAAKLSKITEE